MRSLAPALALILAASAAASQSLPCGEPYTIRPGDSLQRLARAAYGPEASYVTLFEANRERLGWANPSLIEVGDVIDVPCPPGVETPDEAAAAEAEEAGALEQEAVPPPETPAQLRVAVSSAGGREEAEAVAALARAAFEARPGEPVEVDVVGEDDPEELAEAGYALSLPWPAPACDEAEPAPAIAAACETFVWSEPVYERIVTGWRIAGPEPTQSVRLCLEPELRALGLYPDAEDPLQAQRCVIALVEGRADVAALSPGAAEAELATLEPGLDVVEVPELIRLVPLAAATRADSEGESLLRRLETGLGALRAEERWFDVVRAALSPASPAD